MDIKEFLTRLYEEQQEIETLLSKYGRKLDGEDWIATAPDYDDNEEDETVQADRFEAEGRSVAIVTSLEERLMQVKAKIKELESSVK